MIDWDKWQEIFDSIRRHKLRTFLTALGVFWGIFMLVLLLGAGQGLNNGIEFQFRDDAVNSIFLNAGVTSEPYKGLPKGRRIQFNNEDYDYLVEQFTDIEYITGRLYLSGDRTVKYKQKNLSYTVQAVHPDHIYLENSEMIAGRYLNESDQKSFNKVAVIGDLVRDNLMDGEDPIGKEINIGGIVYQVIGVFTDSGGENQRRMIYIPISTGQKVYTGRDDIHRLMFTTGDLSVEESSALEERVRLALARRHQFSPEDKRALYTFNLAAEYHQMQNLFLAIRIFVWFVGIGSIIAGVIGVSNIMLIIVKDRTKEIGIRKALGATPRSIVAMILQEAIFITAMAGYLGIIAGIALLSLAGSVETEFFRNPQINIGVVLSATLVLVIAGAVAGLFPAMQAARINPIEAMRQ